MKTIQIKVNTLIYSLFYLFVEWLINWLIDYLFFYFLIHQLIALLSYLLYFFELFHANSTLIIPCHWINYSWGHLRKCGTSIYVMHYVSISLSPFSILSSLTLGVEIVHGLSMMRCGYVWINIHISHPRIGIHKTVQRENLKLYARTSSQPLFFCLSVCLLAFLSLSLSLSRCIMEFTITKLHDVFLLYRTLVYIRVKVWALY